MSLNDKLAHLRGGMTGLVRTAWEDLVARLNGAEVAAQAAKVGEKAPSFLLPNAEGRLVTLEDLLAAGPLVLTFFRGGWCPYCDVTMREMETALPGIAAAGGTFAAVWPETGGLALRTKQERRLGYELLVDVDNAVAMQFGVVFRVPERYRQVLADGGIDLAARQGNPDLLLPVPATFIIVPDGTIRYKHVGPLTAEEMPGFLNKVRQAGR